MDSPSYGGVLKLIEDESFTAAKKKDDTFRSSEGHEISFLEAETNGSDDFFFYVFLLMAVTEAFVFLTGKVEWLWCCCARWHQQVVDVACQVTESLETPSLREMPEPVLQLEREIERLQGHLESVQVDRGRQLRHV